MKGSDKPFDVKLGVPLLGKGKRGKPLPAMTREDIPPADRGLYAGLAEFGFTWEDWLTFQAEKHLAGETLDRPQRRRRKND
jgi:hypothetical protein